MKLKVISLNANLFLFCAKLTFEGNARAQKRAFGWKKIATIQNACYGPHYFLQIQIVSDTFPLFGNFIVFLLFLLCFDVSVATICVDRMR